MSMAPRRCAFLSMDSLDSFVCYDELLYEPMARHGWQCDTVSWRNEQIHWDRFEAVLIRSTWDYQEDPNRFLKVLERIESSPAKLANSLALVRWNLAKTYLRDLAGRGIDIVPSYFPKRFDKETCRRAFGEFNCHRLVVKPVIGANADHTYPLQPEDPRIEDLQQIFTNRPCLVQPFLDNVMTEGEFSLFFFGGTYSHTILKTPKEGDFRVQEEHGSSLQTVEPTPQLLTLATEAMAVVDPQPLYGRIDFVRHQDRFLVMELELIEPSLYFTMDPESPERFTTAFVNWMNHGDNPLSPAT